MKRNQKCCLWCEKIFISHPRQQDRQKACFDPKCQNQQKQFSHKIWKQKNLKTFKKNQKDWQKDHPGYWRAYRASHPEYTDRNRKQSRIHKSFVKNGLQKRIDILQLSKKQRKLGKFWSLPRFAKHPRSLIPLLFAYTCSHQKITM